MRSAILCADGAQPRAARSFAVWSEWSVRDEDQVTRKSDAAPAPSHSQARLGALGMGRDNDRSSSAKPGAGDRNVAVALAHAVVTRSGKRSCGPVGLERSVGVRWVTKRVAYASGDAEGEAIVSPNCPDAP
jgi:hypothetical protein